MYLTCAIIPESAVTEAEAAVCQMQEDDLVLLCVRIGELLFHVADYRLLAGALQVSYMHARISTNTVG